MIKKQALQFLDEYQAPCEKYKLQIEADSDVLVVKSCNPKWLAKDLTQMRKTFQTDKGTL